MSNSVAIYKN